MKDEISSLQTQMNKHGYIGDEDLLTSLVLMQQLQRPLLIEGEAGVGKTEIAKVLAEVKESKLIRLQCYEGLDSNTTVYEWNYSKQLLSIKLSENKSQTSQNIFSRDYLLERPLLKAISEKQSPVLLIDEIDRADEAFEAFLLELLSDFQISIPELGTIQATTIPLVILTSNNTRDLSDALRRRCLFHHLDFPDYEKELNIILTKTPSIENKLAEQIVAFIQKLRQMDLRKRPGIAETLDWAAALMALNVPDLFQHVEVIVNTRSCLLKTQEDMDAFNHESTTSLIKEIA